ncbi:uncharacterized protein [Physcomitrium patens]|uniref:uncharacterized protein isoform X4 n=2 Tax=Physcomitrium patens TaxID=3218 RepID=UPI003CCCCD23
MSCSGFSFQFACMQLRRVAVEIFKVGSSCSSEHDIFCNRVGTGVQVEVEQLIYMLISGECKNLRYVPFISLRKVPVLLASTCRRREIPGNHRRMSINCCIPLHPGVC